MQRALPVPILASENEPEREVARPYRNTLLGQGGRSLPPASLPRKNANATRCDSVGRKMRQQCWCCEGEGYSRTVLAERQRGRDTMRSAGNPRLWRKTVEYEEVLPMPDAPSRFSLARA